MKCPVIIIHRGYSDYLKWAVLQAKASGNEVILLGDEKNLKLSAYVKHEYISDYGHSDYPTFLKNYKHMSSNDYKFELVCFERWFVLLEYLKRNSFEKVLHLDSDVMIYEEADKILQYFSGKFMAAYHIPEQTYSDNRWVAVPHTSFWTTQGLEKLCTFIIDEYTKGLEELKLKWQWHISSKAPGGICDMTLLYLFYRQNEDKIVNLAQTFNETFTFDSNINSPENYFQNEFSMTRKFFISIKNVFFENKIPYSKNLVLNKNIKLFALHCQGKAKILMFIFYKGKKEAADYLAYYLFLIPFLYKRMIGSIKSKLKTG